MYNLPRNNDDDEDDDGANPWKWPNKGLPDTEPPRGVPITPWPEETDDDDDDDDDDKVKYRR